MMSWWVDLYSRIYMVLIIWDHTDCTITGTTASKEIMPVPVFKRSKVLVGRIYR